MNLSRRIKIARACIFLTRVRRHIRELKMPALENLADWSIRTIETKKNLKIKELQRSVSDLTSRTDSILPELRTLDQLIEGRKQQVLAARSALLEESAQRTWTNFDRVILSKFVSGHDIPLIL